MKLKLPQVTLIGIDCVNVERLQIAMDICEKEIEFGSVKLLTSILSTDKRIIKIPQIRNKEEYSKFCIKNLKDFVDTDFVLIIQYDGFILNPQSWSDEFLNYDYIGAPWFVHEEFWFKKFNFPKELLDTLVVGNGGFSLRSKKFLKISSDLFNDGYFKTYHPEDLVMCVWNRKLVENNGIKFAPPEIAEKFSIEGEDHIYDKQFGFHGYSWTNIDKWINENLGYFIIVRDYNSAREMVVKV